VGFNSAFKGLIYCGAFATEHYKSISPSSTMTDFIPVYRHVTNGERLKVFMCQWILGSLLKVMK